MTVSYDKIGVRRLVDAISSIMAIIQIEQLVVAS